MILMIADKGIAAPPWLPSAPHSAVGIEHLGLPWPELRARVKEDRLPSGIIHKAIARFHPDTREWDGSELADRYLACLAAYADVTYVDKRTHEASRQARQKSKVFASLVHRIEKAGEYGKIAGQLSTQFGTHPIEAPSILD